MSSIYFGTFETDTTTACATLDLGGTVKITNLGTPVSSDDIANQSYVESVLAVFDAKQSCKYATVSNISDFTTKATVEAALDPVSASAPTLVDGDRVLVKDQSTLTQNGIYSWNNGAGELQRASDHDGTPAGEVSGGNHTFVEQGDTLESSSWMITGSESLTIGVSDIVWVLWTGANAVTDHTQLEPSSIGTYTHAQIDTHIADSTIHYLQTAIDHDNISNNGGAGSHATIDSHISNTSNPHSVTFAQVTPTTTKGDIIVHNGTSSTRLGIGTDGYALTADSTQTEGIAWKASTATLTLEGEVELPRMYQAVDGGAAAASTFGETVCFSGDGSVLVIYSRESTTSAATNHSIHFYTRSGTTYSLSQATNLSTPLTQYGWPMAVSDDGTYVAIQGSTVSKNTVLVWRQSSPGVWTDDTSGGFNAINNGASSSSVMYSLSFDTTGTYLAVGATNVIGTISYADVWERGADWSTRTNRFAQNDNTRTAYSLAQLSYDGSYLLWSRQDDSVSSQQGQVTVHLKSTSYSTTPQKTIVYSNDHAWTGTANVVIGINNDGSEIALLWPGTSPEVVFYTRSGTKWERSSKYISLSTNVHSTVNVNKFVGWSTDGNSIALQLGQGDLSSRSSIWIYTRKTSSSQFVPLQKFWNPQASALTSDIDYGFTHDTLLRCVASSITKAFDYVAATNVISTVTNNSVVICRKGTTHWLSQTTTMNDNAISCGLTSGEYYYDQTGQVRRVLATDGTVVPLPEFASYFSDSASMTSSVRSAFEYYYAEDTTNSSSSTFPSTLLTLSETITAGDWNIMATIVYNSNSNNDGCEWILYDNTGASTLRYSYQETSEATGTTYFTFKCQQTYTAGTRSISLIIDNNNGWSGTVNWYFLNILMYKV